MIHSAPRRPLSELCTLTSGGTPPRSIPEYFGGAVPWVKISDLLQGEIRSTEEHISDAGLANSAAKVLPAGTVLISIFATIGRTATLAIDAATNQAIAGITPRDPKELLPAFLRYFLDSQRPALERKARGVAQPNINQSVLKSLEVPCPSIQRQQRIVDLLSRAENIVRMRREAEKKAKEIIPALFLDMFGDPATNPKGWDVKRVGDIASYTRYGPRFPDRKYAETGAHILRTTDMDTSGNVRWEESPVLPVTQEEVSRFSLRPGTVVVTRTGATIGKIALFRGADRPCIAGAYLIELGTTDDVDPEYLLALLLSDYGQSALTSGSRAVAQPNLNAPTIRAIPLPIPPKAFQSSFAKRVSSFQALCRQQTGAIAVAEAAFQSLLAGMFFDGRTE